MYHYVCIHSDNSKRCIIVYTYIVTIVRDVSLCMYTYYISDNSKTCIIVYVYIVTIVRHVSLCMYT